MRIPIVVFLTISFIVILASLRQSTPKWKLAVPEITITNCLVYKDQTFYKDLDEIRTSYRPKKIKVEHKDHFENCADAKRQAKSDSKKGGLRIIRINGFIGEFPRKDILYERLLGVEIINTGCYIYQWSDCYNEEMENQIKNKYDPKILTLLDEHEKLRGEKIFIDIENKELVNVSRQPGMGMNKSNFTREVSEIKCFENIIYMSFEILIQKSGKVGKVVQTGGNSDRECKGKLKKLIKNYEGWQPAMKDDKPIDTIINFLLIF